MCADRSSARLAYRFMRGNTQSQCMRNIEGRYEKPREMRKQSARRQLAGVLASVNKSAMLVKLGLQGLLVLLAVGPVVRYFGSE